MYAYVKFIEDNICEYVETNKIKHFDPDDIHLYEKKFKIKWTDGEFYPGAIIYVRDTMEELRKVVDKKRVVFRNKDLLMSDVSESDVDEVDDGNNRKKKIPSNNINPSVKKIFETQILKKFHQSELPKSGGNPNITPYKENDGDSGNDSCDAFGPNNRNTPRAIRCSTSSSELTAEIDKMKIIEREQEQQIKELTKLNMELQRDVININRALVEKIEKMVTGKSTNKDNVEIGAVVDDEGEGFSSLDFQVHLGQNVFIKKCSYDSANVTSRSGTQFVKNIAMAVFGALTLKNSSVTGKTSNNIKKEICRPALCPTKLSAVHDIYAFYLKNKGYSKLETERELKHVNYYLASKISDLNRLPRVKKTKPSQDVTGNEEVLDEESDDQGGVQLVEEEAGVNI